MVSRAPALLFTLLPALAGCVPELDDRLSTITGPRVLAIASLPAEAKPTAEVGYRALYVDPTGGRDGAALSWAFCNQRKPLTDQGTLSPACLASSGDALGPIGEGSEVSGVLPDEGCRLFGPDRPAPKPDEPTGRATDPDPSGGFYQPLRVIERDHENAVAVGTTRLLCGLSTATPADAAAFGRRYRANENPAPSALTVGAATIPPDATGSAPGAKARPGEALTLTAAWPSCPLVAACGDGVCDIDEDLEACAMDCTAPVGCGGSERYLWFDPEARALSVRREAMVVSWFATAGSFDAERTGHPEDEADQRESANVWTAPSTPGEVTLWVVLRDDRGGVGWQRYRIAVSP
jgi:hypothetical protein